MTTLVTIGNARQPFTRLLNQVRFILPMLPRPVVVQHGHTSFSDEDCITKPFLEMEEFAQLVKDSQLLIMHAGAGSVITALNAGQIPVVVPRLARYSEHVDDHQSEFAIEMARLGKVVLADPVENLAKSVSQSIEANRGSRAQGETHLVQLVREVLLNYSR